MKLQEIKQDEKHVELLTMLTNFISTSWDEVGILKATIQNVGETFKGLTNTKEVTESIQDLLDSYLVCIGNLEGIVQGKKYLDTDLSEISDQAQKEIVTESREVVKDVTRVITEKLEKSDLEQELLAKTETKPVAKKETERVSEPFEFFCEFDDPVN